MQFPQSVTLHSVVSVDATGIRDWCFPLHVHEKELEISLVLAGSGTFYCGGRSYPMHTGDLTIKNAGVVHAERSENGDPLRQICISFSGYREWTEHPNQMLPDGASPVLSSGADFTLLAGIFSWLAEHGTDNASEHVAVCRQLTEAALELIAARLTHRPAAHGGRRTAGEKADTVREVLAWVDAHYGEKITLQGLAERFYISPFYLEKRFRAVTGYSVNQYVIDRRMGEAQERLIFSDDSIKEIARQVGYDNLQYFYATFKRYAGCHRRCFAADIKHKKAGPAMPTPLPVWDDQFISVRII